MITLGFLLVVVVVQYSSAQVIPYGMPNRATNFGNTAKQIDINRGLPNGIGRTMPVTANNMAQRNVNIRQNLANPYYKNTNNMAYTSPKAVNTNFASTLKSTLTNDITTTAIENYANANLMTNIAMPAVIDNAPNVATYNFGNSPIPVTVSGTSTGNNAVGINIVADNLEVKGLVSVVGRMPIFGAVTLDGNVPSDGKASVNYGCGGSSTA